MVQHKLICSTNCCSDSLPWCRGTKGCRKRVPGVPPINTIPWSSYLFDRRGVPPNIYKNLIRVPQTKKGWELLNYGFKLSISCVSKNLKNWLVFQNINQFFKVVNYLKFAVEPRSDKLREEREWKFVWNISFSFFKFKSNFRFKNESKLCTIEWFWFVWVRLTPIYTIKTQYNEKQTISCELWNFQSTLIFKNLNLRGHSNNTWHSTGGGMGRGCRKCHTTFFDFLNLDCNAFGRVIIECRIRLNKTLGFYIFQ